MAAVTMLKFSFNGYNSTAIAYISTNFDANSENEVPEAVLTLKCYLPILVSKFSENYALLKTWI